MAVHNQIEYASIEELKLDGRNPRLGRENIRKRLNQDQILDVMKDWSLEELAVSFLETGYWPQEALIVVRQNGDLLVVEGNRRLAALQLLKDAAGGNAISRKWEGFVRDVPPEKSLFESIPYIEADERDDINAFLGFRHVTGIKEWHPAEKAEFIGNLIEEERLSYEQVMRRIGSKTPNVRQNYIAYRMLLQMEHLGDVSMEHVEERFSVLYLSLRTDGVKSYLQVDIMADPASARTPIPTSHLTNLKNFALWLFGDGERPPIFSDSRRVDDFGHILMSSKAVEYLERTDRPSFEMAFELSGGDEPQVVEYVRQSADKLRLALQRAHLYKKSAKLKEAVGEASRHAIQLASFLPRTRWRTY